MYNLQKILTCLDGLVGFYDKKDINLQELDSVLYQTSSGLHWEDGHALITMENLQAIADNEEASDWPAYDPINEYVKGSIVFAGNGPSDVLWIAKSDLSEGIPPPDSPMGADYWDKTSPLAVWLKRKIKAAQANLVTSMVKKNELSKVSKTLLEDGQVYQGAANFADKEVKTGRFVGMQFVFRNYQHLVAVITQIGLQFSDNLFAASEDEKLKIYLYHTSQNEPVKIFEVEATKRLSVDWLDMEDCILGGLSSYDIGGAWFLGYYEEDLPMGIQAVNRTGFNFGSGPCTTCTGNDGGFSKWFRYVSILPIANAAINEEREVFDWSYNQYYNEGKTFGINLRLSIGCDISNVVCRQKSLLDKALIAQFTVDMVTEMAFNTRVNRLAEVTKQKAMFALDDRGDSANRPQKGLVSMLADEIKDVVFNFSDLDNVCLPCTGGGGIKYGSI